MLNSIAFTERLQKVLDYYELSASAFAEKIGIGRSSISHIVSGRNKPSLEFVLNILENFKEVSFDWLLHGKGEFPKSINISSTSYNEIEKKAPQNLFEKKASDENEINLFSNTPKITAPIQSSIIGSTTENYSEIERIVIFYKNGKFKEYKN